MATRAVTVKLSEQRQAGVFKCYKRFIGGRVFYLSHDRDESIRMVLALLAKWRELKQSGKGWTPDVVASVLALFRQRTAKPVSGGRATALHKAIDAYLGDYKDRVSDSRYQRHATALATYKAQQSDCSLSSVTWDKLNVTIAHFVARPKTSHGSPMAVATVQTTLKAVRALYDWLDSSGQWDAPKRLDRLFRVNYQALRTPLEVKRHGLGPVTFTLAELQTLWRQATPRQRLYLGLALNIGETAQGLAGLLKEDLTRGGETWVIDRNRGKTGVRGVYHLWPEVQELLAAEMDSDAVEPLLLKSSDGKPLVWFHRTSRVDSVSKTWANLLKRCPTVRRMGHKYLRKTGASLIEALTGSDRVAELYLSHQGESVAKRHYLARDFSRLGDALSSLRQCLAPVLVNASSQPATPPRTAA